MLFSWQCVLVSIVSHGLLHLGSLLLQVDGCTDFLFNNELNYEQTLKLLRPPFLTIKTSRAYLSSTPLNQKSFESSLLFCLNLLLSGGGRKLEKQGGDQR
jgi:hypothetical protein